MSQESKTTTLEIIQIVDGNEVKFQLPNVISFTELKQTLAPHVFAFKCTSENTGPVTFNGKTLHLNKNGKPLVAGDLKEGQYFTVNPDTGEVYYEQN